MKNKVKSIIVGTFIAVIAFTAGGCINSSINAAKSNRMNSDWGTNYFNRAIIDTHKEVIEVEVQKWADYDGSDAIIVVTTDGKCYYTHLRDCTLIGDGYQ